MEVGLIFKIAAVGILVTILSQVLKHSGREEHAFLLSLVKCNISALLRHDPDHAQRFELCDAL